MPPPLKPFGKGHIPHTLNTAGGGAGEGGVVGSHIGETSGVGSESDSYGWDWPVRTKNTLNISFSVRNNDIFDVMMQNKGKVKSQGPY